MLLIKDLSMEIVCEITSDYILKISVRNEETKEVLVSHEPISIH